MIIRFIHRLLFAAALAVGLITVSCGDFKPHAITWEDIAQTIPGDPAFVVSVNIDFVNDSALNDIWATNDVMDLLRKGVALDTVKPSHFVVVVMPKATYITWPLPTPRSVAKKVSDWPTASLNNTVDGHMITQGKASLVLSSTQAWVVNNIHGEKYVNQLLSAAMNTKAGHVVPFANCITSTPQAMEGVVPYEGKYYAIQLNHEDGLLRVDVDAYTKLNKRVDIIDGLGRLPIEFINEASPYSPFGAIEINRGTMPSVLKRLAKLTGKTKIEMGANMLASSFEDAQGMVLANWNDEFINVRVPFSTAEAAHVSAKKIEKILKTVKFDLAVKVERDTLVFGKGIDNVLPKDDHNHLTPHRHSETENPSAIAFARLDINKHDPVELYFELAPTHARLQVDFKENTKNLAETVELIKTIIFRVL